MILLMLLPNSKSLNLLIQKKSSIPISRVLCPTLAGREPVIYLLRRLPYGSSILPSIVADASDGQPSTDGIRELAASRRNSLTITRQLVVSYTTFSPLPPTEAGAVILFSRILLSPTAGIFTSGVSYAARTFLSRSSLPRMEGG